MKELKQIGKRMRDAPDGQISLTDPDARSMATSGRGTGIVGYNVQTAVDTKHHMIVAHEVTNVGHDRTQLASMARRARAVVGKKLTALADRGYFSGEDPGLRSGGDGSLGSFAGNDARTCCNHHLLYFGVDYVVFNQ